MDLIERMKRGVILWDGGMGTALLQRGLPKGAPPESWILERPEDLREVHRAFFEAGSDLVQTNTFGANRVRLAGFGLDGKIREINLAAAEIALSVCPEGKFVVGDLGPTGMADLGGEARIEEAFAEQARYLTEAGVALLHIETLSGRAEAHAALHGAKSGSSLPVIISITLRRDPDGVRTLGGEDPLEVWKSIEEEGADAVGTNCMLEAPDIALVCKRYRSAISVPFVAQPAKRVSLDLSTFQESVEDLVRAGANGLGGCCGVGAAEIASAAERLEQAGLRSP